MPSKKFNLVLDEDPNGFLKSTYIVEHPLPWTSRFTPRQHVLGDAVCQMDADFFSDRWPFGSDKQRRAFLDMNLSLWSVSVCAHGMDSRIPIYSRFITVLFLIDGMFTLAGDCSEADFTQDMLDKWGNEEVLLLQPIRVNLLR
jgi:hypothetical protein